MEDKTTIELRELPENKIRLFRNRDAEIVPTPEAVRNSTQIAPDSIPESITITPMTHRDCEIRERLKYAMDMKMKMANHEAGITAEEIKSHADDVSAFVKMRTERANDALAILEDESVDTDERIAKSEAIHAEIQAEYNRIVSKHSDLIYKQNKRDMTAFYEAEDALRENTVRMVCSNCKAIRIGDEDVKITHETIDCIHPDLIWWIVYEIESRSYLTSGEITGFR